MTESMSISSACHAVYLSKVAVLHDEMADEDHAELRQIETVA